MSVHSCNDFQKLEGELGPHKQSGYLLSRGNKKSGLSHSHLRLIAKGKATKIKESFRINSTSWKEIIDLCFHCVCTAEGLVLLNCKVGENSWDPL